MIVQPVHVSVVFAAYKEHQRLRPASEHPHGEDALRVKMQQLRWLFGPTPQHSWDLTVVDDGCTEGSGELAKEIFEQEAREDEEVAVLFLKDAIEHELPIARGLSSTTESQKGGAIRLGLWQASLRTKDRLHVVIFTDADLSTHLGQIGLLVSPIINDRFVAAVGSRRRPTSVVVKSGARNDRGKLFIYLWKRMLPQLTGIVDTQCGFKAFDADNLRTWIEETTDNRFSFDIEALMRISIDHPDGIAKVPIAWIDSEAASTTVELQPYLPMLKSVAALHRRHITHSTRGESFAELVEKLDEDSFATLVDNVPKEIVERDPHEFDEFEDISAEDLSRAAGLSVSNQN